MRERAETPIEDPQAHLERTLIDQYLQERGSSFETLINKPSEESRALLAKASQYALGRLAEIDARAAYVHEIHDAKTGKRTTGEPGSR
jgi:hypothetical protein